MVDHVRSEEDWVLANASEFVANMKDAHAEIARGKRGVPLDVVLAELEGEAAE
jgi:hypothetical protein